MMFFILFLSLLVSYVLTPTLFRVLLILATIVLVTLMAAQFTLLLFLTRLL